MISVVVSGFLVSLSLIASIGAQSMFVLKQGLKREYIGTIIIFSFLSDIVLILLGIYGLGLFIAKSYLFKTIISWIGVVFLTSYGFLNLKSAIKGHKFVNLDNTTANIKVINRKKILFMCFALTWLNPHVYLDMIVLVGSVANKYAPYQGSFAVGSILSSLVFFLTLGYGGRLLQPFFKNKYTWKVLDFLVSLLMFYIAFKIYMDFIH